MTTPSFYFGIGDDWPMPITYTDGNGVAINLSGSTVGGELFLAYQTASVLELTAASGGIVSTDYPNGKFTFLVPKGTAPVEVVDRSVSKIGPNRLQVWVINSLGYRETIAIFPIYVFDPRTVDPAVFPQNQTGTITSAGTQGPAGPAGVTSVNGKTGTAIVLGAHDVGALTPAEVASQAAALALILG